MHRLAAPLFILLLTALAFAQGEIQTPTPEATTPAETTQPSAPAETPPSAEPSPAPATTPSGEATPPTGTPSPETAAEAAPEVAETAETAETESTATSDALEIIIIASGTLNEAWGDQSKVEALKEAMGKSIRYIPKNMDVGLRVSGHRVPASEADRSCLDSELLIAPTAQGQSILLAQLSGIQAQGVHSLVQTLSRSLADLNDYAGKKNIILITDGSEACVEQDPAAYLAAESLGQRGYRIHIRGIGIPVEKSQGLAQLAKLTGGSFSNAQDPLYLQRQLVIALQQSGGETPDAPAGQPSEPGTAPAPAQQPMAQSPAGTTPTPIPAAPPPSGVKPEPKEPPIVGPAPLPFDPAKFMKMMIGEMKKIIPKPSKPPPPPPPPPTPAFSATSLTIIIIETILLALALVGIVLLGLKQYRQ